MAPVSFKIQDDPPRHEGWLRKKGKRLGFWTKRFCVLDWEETHRPGASTHKAVLLCYDGDDTTKEPHTTVSLERCTVLPEPSLDEVGGKGEPMFALSLDTQGAGGGGRVMVLYAESEDERDAWVQDLRWSAVNTNIDNGFEIDRVKPEGCLGTGSFSVVWRGRAKYPDLRGAGKGQVWALKEISKTDLSYVEEERVREEVRVQRRVGEHPHIVFMKEFVETDSSYVLVMEVLAGGMLLDLVVDSPQGFSEMGVLHVMRQLLEALVYMHALGIVHRDLKFENLLLANETTALAAAHIKICDFGCAAWTRPDARALDVSLAGDGLLRDLCGSPGYIAPEVIAAAAGGGAYGLQADVWSIGVVLYILLSGSPPFAGGTAEESMAKTSAGLVDYKPLLHCTPAARDLVSTMLDKNPRRRISAADAREHAWMRGEGVGTTTLIIKDNVRALRGALRDTRASLGQVVARSGPGKALSSLASAAAAKFFK